MKTYYQTTDGTDYTLASHAVLSAPVSVEMHLNTDTSLPKRFGKKIKAAGGGYSNCRRYGSHRYVTLPFSNDTRDLINDLLRRYGKTGGKGTTVVARDTGIRGAQARMIVHKAPHVGEHDSPIRHWEERYWRSIQNAVDRGLCNLHEGTPPEATFVERETVALNVAKRAHERVEAAKVALAEAEAALVEAEAGVTAVREEILAASRRAS